MPTLVWRVCAIDQRRHPNVVQDLGEVRPDGSPGARMVQMVDEAGNPLSHFEPTLSSKPSQSHMLLTTPIGTENVVIYEGMKIWAGWWDLDGGAWAVPTFGGWILEQRGGTWGEEHTIECDLVDFGLLWDRVWVRGWPSPITTIPPLGWPPGYSVAAWLYGAGAGGSFANGLVPAHYGSLLAPAIDDVFDTLTFDAFRPGNVRPDQSDQLGQTYWMKLGDALRMIADAVQLVYPDVRVATWFQAQGTGAAIGPCFHFHNANTPGADGPTYATDATGDEILMEQPFSHQRDWRNVATAVTIVGNGGVPTEDGPIWATATDPGAVAAYPCEYSRSGAWEQVYFANDISTHEQAQRLAEAILPQVSGARGTISFYANPPTPPVYGSWPLLRDPVEGLNRRFRLNEISVEGSRYKLTVGEVPLDVADLLRAASTDAFLLNQGGGLPTVGYSRAGSPDASRPARTPLVAGPMGGLQNLLQPHYNDLTALTVRASGAFRPDPVTGLPPPDPDPPTTNLLTFQDSLGQETDWHDRDGAGHPIHLSLSFTAAGQTIKWRAISRGAFIALYTDPGTGSASATLNGDAVSVPFAFVKGDLLVVTSGGSGYDATDPLNATYTEDAATTDPYPEPP